MYQQVIVHLAQVEDIIQTLYNNTGKHLARSKFRTTSRKQTVQLY